MKARTVSLLVAVVVAIVGVVTVIVVRSNQTGTDFTIPLIHVKIPFIHASQNPTATYCNQVSDQQSQIGAIANSSDSQTALINGLPLFQSLASSAPPDISAQWMTLTTAIAGLKSAIAATGYQPTDFANGTFPPHITAAQKSAVVAAADTLGSSTTSTALSAIVQEVRDVCQVDLDL